MKTLFCALFLNILCHTVVSPPFARWTTTELILNNGIVQRVIQLPSPEGHFLTTSYKPVIGEFKYFLPSNTDFQIEGNRNPHFRERRMAFGRG